MSRVLRNCVLALLFAAAGGVAAQAAKSARVGVLLFSSPEGDPNLATFRKGMAELGYVEGRNLTLLYRYAEGKPERLSQLASDLVALKPDVIFALGGDVAPFARTATNSIPIIAAVSTDPVRSGLVSNLARPGANVSGVTYVSSELAGKRLQLLKEVMPGLDRVAVLWNPNHVDPEYSDTQSAGRTLGLRVQSLEVRGPDDFDAAFRAAVAEQAQALIVVSSRLMIFQRQRILEFAERERIPVVGGWGPWAEGGALMSYGPDLDVSVRRAAAYVDRVLKGASPADLPIERPTKFDLVINVKTARSLAVPIPPSLRVQSARVIE